MKEWKWNVYYRAIGIEERERGEDGVGKEENQSKPKKKNFFKVQEGKERQEKYINRKKLVKGEKYSVQPCRKLSTWKKSRLMEVIRIIFWKIHDFQIDQFTLMIRWWVVNFKTINFFISMNFFRCCINFYMHYTVFINETIKSDFYV